MDGEGLNPVIILFHDRMITRTAIGGNPGTATPEPRRSWKYPRSGTVIGTPERKTGTFMKTAKLP